jgi:WD repeat-containing protein 61
MPVRALAFSPDSKLMLSGSDDKYVKVHDVYVLHHTCRATGTTGEGICRNTDKSSVVATFSGHKSWVLDVDFSPTGSGFASSSADGTVRVWDLARRQTDHLFAEHSDQASERGRLMKIGYRYGA